MSFSPNQHVVLPVKKKKKKKKEKLLFLQHIDGDFYD